MTYVLVHGSWHSGQAWDRVVPLLAASGHRVFTPSLTGHGEKAHLLTPEVGLATHIADVVDLIVGEDLTDVILVGHSYSGMVISGVTNQIPDRIAELVFLDAMVPADGETTIDVMPVTQHAIDLAAGTEMPWRVAPMAEMPAPYGLFGVTDPADKAWLRTMLSDESVRCYQQPVRLDTRPWTQSRAPTSTASVSNPKASPGGPSPPYNPTANRPSSGSSAPATTA
jgi:pimeloyl-ACP methyl ester carboxylesterase